MEHHLNAFDDYFIKSRLLTVRTDTKGREILDTHNGNKQLSYVVVSGIAAPGAFDSVFKTHPTVEGVIHTASLFHFRATNLDTDILKPAINGKINILKAIKQYARLVKKIIITSSMAAVLNPFTKPPKYTEESWNPITEEEVLRGPVMTYLGSITFAKRAAWEFVEKELPNVGLATINPPLHWPNRISPPFFGTA
ncbi:hypothetical protein BS50DRAFT_639902 [Corynespora cassiicola Philippines]|uniref:NAD(P)-binding protein n=1 Tax=Corynespora cassiicola Philippines TaxID=1448308 RepID=A0A2T2N604_CORCC|nr:hypothetical protein BS50DRAFT_639902 [Corynespora cassiicola Philippines]